MLVAIRCSFGAPGAFSAFFSLRLKCSGRPQRKRKAGRKARFLEKNVVGEVLDAKMTVSADMIYPLRQDLFRLRGKTVYERR